MHIDHAFADRQAIINSTLRRFGRRMVVQHSAFRTGFGKISLAIAGAMLAAAMITMLIGALTDATLYTQIFPGVDCMGLGFMEFLTALFPCIAGLAALEEKSYYTL